VKTIFPSLALLEDQKHRLAGLASRRLPGVVLVCVQHLLETTGSLIESLIALGLRPKATFVLGKVYSTNSSVVSALRQLGTNVVEPRVPLVPGEYRTVFGEDVDELWRLVSEALHVLAVSQVVVLDDGGGCLAHIPEDLLSYTTVVGVEQTTSGVVRLPGSLTLPVVHVATSAAKRCLEPIMIARASLARVATRMRRGSTEVRCGVIGIGNIGRALVGELLARGQRVHVFDREKHLAATVPGATWCDSPQELVAECQVLFGCTGEDVFAGCKWLESVTGRKTFASCSSQDREFLEILGLVDRRCDCAAWDPLASVRIELEFGSLEVLRGGFPVNFDGSRESVPASEIQLTRFLLLGAVVQALYAGEESPRRAGRGVMVSPSLQRYGVGRWFRLVPSRRADYSREVVAGFSSLEWIVSKSGGEYRAACELEEAFRGIPIDH
jgi:hypothetical protein